VGSSAGAGSRRSERQSCQAASCGGSWA
jgi:hypothetical protein